MATVYLGSFLIVHDFFWFTNVKKGAILIVNKSNVKYVVGSVQSRPKTLR